LISVLDTNVLSELMKVTSDQRVVEFVDKLTIADIYVSAVTIAEILYGIERLAPGQRRERLRRFADTYFAPMTGRVLDFTEPAANRYATIVATREQLGRPISTADAMIAATCLDAKATLITRNIKDFVGIGLDAIDPWGAR
jgi:toxin FitB